MLPYDVILKQPDLFESHPVEGILIADLVHASGAPSHASQWSSPGAVSLEVMASELCCVLADVYHLYMSRGW